MNLYKIRYTLSNDRSLMNINLSVIADSKEEIQSVIDKGKRQIINFENCPNSAIIKYKILKKQAIL